MILQPMQKLVYFGLICALSFWFAKVEIQIEGTDGWAKNLPTWRVENHWLLKIFFGGRAMTGYHAWVISFIFILFHIPVAFTDQWTLAFEGRVMGGFILFWLFEDFLWFVLNPGYGIKKFKKEFISWHPNWFLAFPVEYWVFCPIGISLVLFC